MEKPEIMIDRVKSKADFIKFVAALIQDLKKNPSGWENNNLERYLDAIQAWTEDMDGYYINNKLPVPENVTWKVFAEILMAAVVYE